jgi:hypothetical protein
MHSPLVVRIKESITLLEQGKTTGAFWIVCDSAEQLQAVLGSLSFLKSDADVQAGPCTPWVLRATAGYILSRTTNGFLHIAKAPSSITPQKLRALIVRLSKKNSVHCVPISNLLKELGTYDTRPGSCSYSVGRYGYIDFK